MRSVFPADGSFTRSAECFRGLAMGDMWAEGGEIRDAATNQTKPYGTTHTLQAPGPMNVHLPLHVRRRPATSTPSTRKTNKYAGKMLDVIGFGDNPRADSPAGHFGHRHFSRYGNPAFPFPICSPRRREIDDIAVVRSMYCTSLTISPPHRHLTGHRGRHF